MQIFTRGANALARMTFVGAVLVVGAAVSLALLLARSPYETDQGIVLAQPVPFSHDHHTAVLGIHCVYCHTSVEESAFAGIPPTQTCMNCHKQIWADSPMLEPVRASWRTQQPIRWNRVHDLPDFAYFNHSIHLKKGIGCTTCHGKVGEMPLIHQENSLQMQWCLDCHRDPGAQVRPREAVFALDYEPPASDEQMRRLFQEYGVPFDPPASVGELGSALVAEYGIASNDNCSTCHR